MNFRWQVAITRAELPDEFIPICGRWRFDTMGMGLFRVPGSYRYVGCWSRISVREAIFQRPPVPRAGPARIDGNGDRAVKVLLWGINYAPESTGIAPFNRELCEYLASRGHQVTAVTAFAYYPVWRKRPEDRRQLFRTEVLGGVNLLRCWCYVPAKVTTLRRIIHELSFCVLSASRILSLPRADVYVVVSPPLALGFFAWLVTALKGSRFVFHVQDLQPDAAVGLGMLKRGWLVQALYAFERLAYAKAAVVSGISRGMMMAFRDKGVAESRRAMLPNWLREGSVLDRGPVARVAAREKFGVRDGALLACYAGNLGRKQSLEILVEAARRLPADSSDETKNVRVIIAGDGAGREALERALANSPGAPVQLLPLLSDADYESLLVAADVALITQAAGTGQFFFPSKLLSVLAAGLPVVAVADESSELAGAVREGGFGEIVPPGAAAGLAGILQKVAGDRDLLRKWSGQAKWVRKFSRERVLPEFEAVLASAAPNGSLSQIF
jgi:colanic acid biosynthesis glycosyl transferase WcaI